MEIFILQRRTNFLIRNQQEFCFQKPKNTSGKYFYNDARFIHDNTPMRDGSVYFPSYIISTIIFRYAPTLTSFGYGDKLAEVKLNIYARKDFVNGTKEFVNASFELCKSC